MADNNFKGSGYFGGNLARAGLLLPAVNRETEIAVETFVDWVPLRHFVIWDSGQGLTATPGTDDLGIIAGTWGTAPLYLSAGDLKAAGATTRYARLQWKMKDTYVDGTAVSVIVLAGMLTTLADTSCVLNLVGYRSDSDMTMTSITVAESNVSMNTDDTYANKTFTLTSTAFTSTTELDLRFAITCTDAATVTAVTPVILGVGIQQSCKGG